MRRSTVSVDSDARLRQAVQLFGADPPAYSGVGVAPNSTFHGKTSHKKRLKKAKVVASAYCGICNVDCSSKEGLDQHRLGKKHKKKLDKLQQPSNPLIGPRENPNAGGGGQKSKRKAARSVEDLEIKRRKVVQGGAAVEAVRTCTVCNVVCNSDTVFNFHLAGQKHASMMKKQEAQLVRRIQDFQL